MVAKPQIQEGARNRAGMPLARAQRLTDRAGETQRKPKSPWIFAAILAVAVAGGGIYVLIEQAQLRDIPADAATSIAAPTVPATIEPTQSPASSQSTTGTTATGGTALAPRPALSRCMAQIESHLTALQTASATAQPWDTKRTHIRSAAQTALNCDTAGVTFEGDFELAASDFADLQVTWDRATGRLAFTIVDSVPPGARLLWPIDQHGKLPQPGNHSRNV